MQTKANMKRMRRGEKPRKYKFKDIQKQRSQKLIPILIPPTVAFRNTDDVIR